MKAKKATVNIGHVTIDGYLCDDGTFGMSTSGLGKLCGFTRTESTSKIMTNKRVKTLAVKGFETYKNISCENMRITLISIDWVPAILQCLALSGNAFATDFLMTLAGLSLQKLFCDSFGQKFETEEMQSWLQARTQGIERRNAWTDAIKDWIDSGNASDNAKRWTYVNVSDRLNKALTGKTAKAWCDELGCVPSTLLDNWSDQHLARIDSIENHAAVLLRKGAEPMDALESAIAFFEFAVCENPRKVISHDAARMRERRAIAKTKGVPASSELCPTL